MSKVTRILWLATRLSLLLVSSAPSWATAAEIRFDVGLCSCRATYDAKRYGKAQIDGSVNLMTGHYNGVGLDTPWVNFDEERRAYQIRFDGATAEVKQADMPAELARVKARMAALVERALHLRPLMLFLMLASDLAERHGCDSLPHRTQRRYLPLLARR